MPRFAANLSFLFTERDFADRFAAAAAAGFKAVEYMFPDGLSPAEVAGPLKAAGLEQALINMPAGDWGKGERGIACLPGREAEFHADVGQIIEYAGALGCRRVHALAGVAPEGVDPDRAHATYVDNLAHAAKAFAAEGIMLLIEPINQRDIPGFFLRDTAQALRVIAEVGAANLKLQFDIYHAQVTEGDLATTLRRHIDAIGHVQVANPPGRNEPSAGEINYSYLFGLLDEIGYDGWIGCEYRPLAGTAEGLAWAREYGIGR
ncbi:2-oxo-tetronate isomerase [Oceanibacterium hippocampi]|uniref:Hydroxypyruvate isomerase n=1 Tax=Oceanibacterium hippocampi TaxID=745714 RepID=A0A1Y5SE40_9PROT|nr:2-oxo-tetronate isomerase [Oceanibacterium hippocampi]SLN37552.1 Hydroxypyruvate isomerase [Oceanibacterium hippocampi]